MSIALTMLFNGLTYGVLLFVMAVGLSVTMGMMNFANLAHVSLAMLGGYLAVTAMERLGVSFLLSLPLAFLGARTAGASPLLRLRRPHAGAAHDRPAVHVGVHGGLDLGAVVQADQRAR